MIMFRIGRASVIAIVVAIASLALWSGRGLPVARAAIGSPSAFPNPVTNPGLSTISLPANETDAGPITFSVTAGSIVSSTCQTAGPVACTSFVHSGDGGSSVTVTTATDGDIFPGESLTLTFTYTPPTVLFSQTVSMTGCQSSLCLPGTITVNPFGFFGGFANQIVLSVPGGVVTCGTFFSVSATVSISGFAVADGTIVVFATNASAATFVTTTFGGVAVATINVPLGFGGTLVITASSGGLFGQAAVQTSCGLAGPPATLVITLTPTSILCGNTASLNVKVFDSFGRTVTDGTLVSFTSTIGTIAATAPTVGGLANAVLTSSTVSSGTAQIVARAGVASTQASLPIICVAAAAPPPPPEPPPPPAPTVPAAAIRPPNTGDGGLVGGE